MVIEIDMMFMYAFNLGRKEVRGGRGGVRADWLSEGP